MSFTDVYIGQYPRAPRGRKTPPETEGPPRRESPFFPPANASPYLELKRRIDSGVYSGEQVDWGAWVARLSKAQIQAFVAEMYDGDPTYGPNSDLPHLVAGLVELLEYVNGLKDGDYALVASEL